MSGAGQWHDLFVMSGGAAAALAGLIFVAVSLNVEAVIAKSSIAQLAARTLCVLVALVILCAFGLAPSPTDRTLGIEVLVLGAALTVLFLGSVLRGTATATFTQSLDDYVVAVLACVPILVGGAWLIAGGDAGFYWLLAEIIGGLVATTYNAWALLIEIRR